MGVLWLLGFWCVVVWGVSQSAKEKLPSCLIVVLVGLITIVPLWPRITTNAVYYYRPDRVFIDGNSTVVTYTAPISTRFLLLPDSLGTVEEDMEQSLSAISRDEMKSFSGEQGKMMGASPSNVLVRVKCGHNLYGGMTVGVAKVVMLPDNSIKTIKVYKSGFTEIE